MADVAQVTEWVKNAGWTGSDIAIAVAIAKAESGWNPTAVSPVNHNGTTDYGLFQINSVHNPTAAEKTDGQANANKAYQVWKGSGWKAWATYNSGAYRKYLDTPTAAAAETPSANSTVVASVSDPLGITDSITNVISEGILILIGIVAIVVGLGLVFHRQIEKPVKAIAKNVKVIPI